MPISLTSAITNRNVDITQLDALFTFMYIGITFQTSFQLLKGVSRSTIKQSEANILKAQILNFGKNRQKAFVRARLPGILIGVIEYSVNKANQVSESDAQSIFEAYLQKLNTIDFEDAQCTALLNLCSAKGLGQVYYTQVLNAKLDSVAVFFSGVTPNSFSNALREFSALLNKRKEALASNTPLPTPTLVPVAPSDTAPPPLVPSPPSAPSEPQEQPLPRVIERVPPAPSNTQAQPTTQELSLKNENDNLKQQLSRQRVSCETAQNKIRWMYGVGGFFVGCAVTYFVCRRMG